MPFTLTVCTVLQLSEPKARLRLSVVVLSRFSSLPSFVLLLVSEKLTAASGMALSLTVKLEILPFSEVGVGVAGVISTPAVSLSRLISASGAIVRPAYLRSSEVTAKLIL